MLKLERTSRNGIINIIVRDKDLLFTRPFALAFALAFAIHLGLIILFQVVPFNIGMSDVIFPPTRVEADAAVNESTLAHIEPVIQTIRGLPPPPSSSPILPNEPKFLTVLPIEYSKAESPNAAAFEKIEKAVYEPEFNPLAGRKKKCLDIVISGILAEQDLLSDGLGNKSIPSLTAVSGLNGVRVVYSVIVEGRTGKIFWFEAKQQPYPSSLDKFAESILNDIKFARAPHLLTMSGEIELHFNQGRE